MKQQVYADENKDFATILKTHKRKTLKFLINNSSLGDKISEDLMGKDTKGILESLTGNKHKNITPNRNKKKSNVIDKDFEEEEDFDIDIL
jgi:hypothetical protein